MVTDERVLEIIDLKRKCESLEKNLASSKAIARQLADDIIMMFVLDYEYSSGLPPTYGHSPMRHSGIFHMLNDFLGEDMVLHLMDQQELRRDVDPENAAPVKTNPQLINKWFIDTDGNMTAFRAEIERRLKMDSQMQKSIVHLLTPWCPEHGEKIKSFDEFEAALRGTCLLCLLEHSPTGEEG